jgi:hypothetical protein
VKPGCHETRRPLRLTLGGALARLGFRATTIRHGRGPTNIDARTGMGSSGGRSTDHLVILERLECDECDECDIMALHPTAPSANVKPTVSDYGIAGRSQVSNSMHFRFESLTTPRLRALGNCVCRSSAQAVAPNPSPSDNQVTTSAIRSGVSDHPGTPRVLKTQLLRTNYTVLNWQPPGSIPVSATMFS